MIEEILKGKDMHSYTTGPCNDEVLWIFPKGFEGIDDDASYIVKYDYHTSADPFDFSRTYTVTHIVKIDSSFFSAYRHY